MSALDKPILWALTMAEVQIATCLTLSRQPKSLSLAKTLLLGATHTLCKIVAKYIPQFVAWVDIMVATEEVAIMLYYPGMTTLGCKDADTRHNAHSSCKCSVEELYEDLANICPYPLVEETYQEVAPLTGLDAIGSKAYI